MELCGIKIKSFNPDKRLEHLLEQSIGELAYNLQKKAIDAYESEKDDYPVYRNCEKWLAYLDAVAEINKTFGTNYSTCFVQLGRYLNNHDPIKKY